MPTPDEILKGISQAAANAYDGSHDERYMADGKGRKAGLKREQGDPVLDSRAIDGFTISMEGPRLRILYHAQAGLQEVHENGFENEIIGRLKDIAKYMRKEYKNVTGNALSITADGEPDIRVEAISRRRTDVRAMQWYNVGGMSNVDELAADSEDNVDGAIRKWLAIGKDTYPGAMKSKNVTRKGKQ